MDSNARSIAKAISYRTLGSASTGLICYILTGQLTLSVGAGAMDVVLKLGLYFAHERVWNHINFGRGKAPEANGYDPDLAAHPLARQPHGPETPFWDGSAPDPGVSHTPQELRLS